MKLGLLGAKKAESQQPASPAAAAAEKKSFPRTKITGIGLSSVAGDQPFALLGMVGTNMTSASPSKDVAVPAPDGGSGDAFALVSGLPELADLTTAEERIQHHSAQALSQALSQLPPETDWQKLAIVTLLPDQATARGKALNQDHLWQLFLALKPELAASSCEFGRETAGAAALLNKYCHKLDQGELDTVLFGGVDSLVDPQSCIEIALQGRLMTQGGAEGIIPGEGAAWLILQPQSAATVAIATICGAALREEPHPAEAHIKEMTGLATAMTTSLAETATAADEIKGVVLPFCGDRLGEMEWYQVTSALWQKRPAPPAAGADQPPQQAEPRERQAVEEWRPHLAIGHTGAALIPLGLTLACARFQLQFPPLENIMVCEAGPFPQRGAIFLQPA
ncbi:MAG: beta-ketoacyl synthase N-terminal-like domain-containing protein [Thermodesulfobacteriota bacterium]